MVRLLNSIFSFLLLSVLTYESHAFYRIRTDLSGKKVFWRSEEIPVKRAHDGSFTPEHMTQDIFSQALDLAYNQWGSIADSALQFTIISHEDPIFTGLYLEGLNQVDPHLGINSIHFIGSEWVNAGGPTWVNLGLGNGTIAVTLSFLRGPNGGHARTTDQITGALLDADIIFNDSDFDFCATGLKNCQANEMDLVTVATHEIGHQIGFEHQHDDMTSIMYRSIRYAEHKTVQADEMAGVKCIYPQTPGSDSYNEACSHEQGGGAPPGSNTYLYGNNQPDNSGACASVAPSSGRPKPPSSNGKAQFALTLLMMMFATWIAKATQGFSFPFNGGRRF